MVNGANVGSGPSYSYVPVQGDVVTVQLQSNYMCRLATTVTSGALAMTVDSIITPHVSIIADSGLAIIEGKTASFTAVVSNAGVNPAYKWILNGYPIPGATNSTYTGNNFHDNDSITCIVTSSGVCHNISTFDWAFITVTPLGVLAHNTGISAIRLVPNPNKGMFSIKGTVAITIDEDMAIEVTDMLGQVVYKGSIRTQKGRIDSQVMLGNTLANGMYLLNLHSDKEQAVLHFVLEQ